MAAKLESEEVVENLYSGFAIAIDEKIHEPAGEDKISEIVEQIESKGIPLVKYDALPSNVGFLDNIRAVSFFILDWELNPISEGPNVEEQVGLQLGDALKDSSFEDSVNFIKSVKGKCFAPIFIFTAKAPESVIEKIVELDEDLYNTEDESRNFILIRSKNSVTGENSMFDEIEKWINSNPAIYSLKMWENSFYRGKNGLFWSLFDKSPKWPEVLWNSYEEDMVDPNSNFNETIFKLVSSRTSLKSIEKDKILKEGAPIIQEELKEVVKGIMYLDSSQLNQDEIRPGDVFKKGGKYLLNIRPECDTVVGRCDGEIYLVKGSKLTSAQAERYFKEKYSKNGIRENHDESVLFGIDGNDFVVFKFNQIVTEEFAQLILDKKRICRVLSPFINNIQQKYAAYTGRVGLPRFPHELMLEVVPGLTEEEEKSG